MEFDDRTPISNQTNIETKLYDPLTESITEIANYLLHKEHPDLSIESWQTKYVLLACSEFVKEYEKEKGNASVS